MKLILTSLLLYSTRLGTLTLLFDFVSMTLRSFEKTKSATTYAWDQWVDVDSKVSTKIHEKVTNYPVVRKGKYSHDLNTEHPNAGFNLDTKQ